MDINLNNLGQLQSLCGRLNVPVPPPPPPPEPPVPQPVAPPVPQPVLYQPTPNIQCWCPCDFRNLPVEPETVDAVLTDLPYVEDWLSNAEDFARWCRHVLKPGGVLVTWYSQHHLDDCMAILGRHLHYQWIFASPIYGTGGMRWLSFIPRYQLALVYSRGEQIRLDRTTDDVAPGGIIDWFPAGPREKKWHKHQKNVCQMQHLVEAFTHEESLVCDPCSGGWTTAHACYLTNRKFVGGDIDPECLGIARERLSNLLKK